VSKSRTLSLEQLPEVFVSNQAIAELVYREVHRGRLKKLGSRLYTRNLNDNPESIVKRNVWQLVADYFPGAVIADRTALEFKPAEDGTIFIVATKSRAVNLPGISIQPRRGVPALESDKPFIGGLFLSSQARAFLENMRSSRARGTKISRTLTRKELEEKLDLLLRRSGEQSLTQLRDDARVLVKTLGLEKESKLLDELIGTFLGTKNAVLISNFGIMRKQGNPYDPERIILFQSLFETLASAAPVTRLTSNMTSAARINQAFFEAYFSNFIEGTEFAVNEAEAIIFEGKIPADRPEDAHDVLGTYQIVSDLQEMQKVPDSFSTFLSLIKSRHAVVMAFRKEKTPGQFKIVPNRAGQVLFVVPELVEGTLQKGFEFYQSLESPFSKAVFMMFLISEVHPFADGNGRLARIMMNAELAAKNEQRIIIPTVYRNNYLASLKALSMNKTTEPLMRTLDFAQKYIAAIDWQDLHTCHRYLELTHAFRDPHEADIEGIRLMLPEHKYGNDG
jgi:hypothetical protein